MNVYIYLNYLISFLVLLLFIFSCMMNWIFWLFIIGHQLVVNTHGQRVAPGVPPQHYQQVKTIKFILYICVEIRFKVFFYFQINVVALGAYFIYYLFHSGTPRTSVSTTATNSASTTTATTGEKL